MSGLGERPTASTSRDLSGLRDGASAATPVRSREDVLFHAYTHLAPEFYSRPCACGGDVTVMASIGDRTNDRAIQVGMRTHQGTAPHEAWRERHGL